MLGIVGTSADRFSGRPHVAWKRPGGGTLVGGQLVANSMPIREVSTADSRRQASMEAGRSRLTQAEFAPSPALRNLIRTTSTARSVSVS